MSPGTHGWEAHLQANPVMRAVEIVLFRPFHGGDVLGQFVDRITAELGPELVQRGVDENLAEPPTLRIPEPIAAALFAALLEHFGGPGADRELRADYQAERARVDKLIEALLNPPRLITFPEQPLIPFPEPKPGVRP
jgi:hypothetical protein